jgi:hypothetical protein
VRRPLLQIAVLAALSLIAAGSAQAHTRFFLSRVTSQYPERAQGQPLTIYGAVFSAKAACVPNRPVYVYGGSGGVRPIIPTLVGQTTTDTSGGYAVTIPNGAAYSGYFAFTSRKTLLRNKAHRHVCLRATSLPTGF